MGQMCSCEFAFSDNDAFGSVLKIMLLCLCTPV